MSAEGSSSSMGNVLVKDETESKLPSSNKRFPADSVNPFQSPFYGSDVALILEEKKLYADKKTLSLHSPVFQAMFDGDFAEKDAEEIEIKETKYGAMVRFLSQMYPVKSFQIDEQVLADILPLADFYQVDHVRLKCENYIGQRLQQPKDLSPKSKMFFLLMCDRFSLTHLEAVLDIASSLPITQMKSNHFESLQKDTKILLLDKRCTITNRLVEDLVSKARSYLYDAIAKGPAFASNGVCASCRESLRLGRCLSCLRHKVQEFLTYCTEKTDDLI